MGAGNPGCGNLTEAVGAEQESYPEGGCPSQQACGSAEAVRSRRYPCLSRKKKFLFLFFLFVLVLLLWGVSEAAVRIFAPEYAHLRFSSTVTGGYPIAGRGGEKYYSQVMEPKQPREVRLAMLGDSVMFGYALPVEKSIPVVVQRKLRAARGDILWSCIGLTGMGSAPTLRRDFFLQ